MLDVLIAAEISAGVYLAAWLAYLIFLWRYAKIHGTASLHDVAEAAKAFPGTRFAVSILGGKSSTTPGS